MNDRNAKRREQFKEKFKSAPLTIDKVCKLCGSDAPHRRCEVSSGGTVQYRSKCTDCYRIWERENKRKHRDKILKYKRERMQKAKQKCVDYLGGKCKFCGYNKSLRALTFHHKNRSEKEFSMCVIKDHNWNKVKKELDKCELACFNCHMEQEEIYESNK